MLAQQAFLAETLVRSVRPVEVRDADGLATSAAQRGSRKRRSLLAQSLTPMATLPLFHAWRPGA
jgi:hypothetical protein